jgi:rhodanese-related sulfurtransferase
MPVVNTSQHLKTLRDAQIVTVRRHGLYAHYRLTDDRVLRIWQSIQDFGEARLTEVHSAIEAFRTDRGQMQAVSAAELRRLMDDEAAILLDVRPSIEYNTGHIPGARSVPLSELEDHLCELSRGTTIVAYCRGPYCVMADDAVTLLRQRGYEARRYADGLPEWRAQGLPVEV